MKKIMFLTMALVLGFTLEAHAISWERDLDAALKKAKTSQRPVMIDFYTDWCGWCKKLDSDTYSAGNVSDLAKNFICVKIDADKNKSTASKYKVEGYPTIIFLNYEGEIDDRVVGYRDANGFADAMSSVLKKTKKPDAKTPGAADNKTPGSAAKPLFVLNGIFYDATAPTALINGSAVKVGDTIEGAKVKKITKVGAELEYQGSIIVLDVR
ncbi:MAG: thioredoxin domain-containing protein [Candidatus Omnitrophica bacterium]|nr:thioredoxin domain-containing protein [Candidatus Omnitrophota bacterium]